MLFCRSRSVAVLFSLIGSVWCATTPVPQGYWLRGRTRDISKTVQPDDYPMPTSVLRGEVSEEKSTAWIGASSDSDGIMTASETKTDEMFPPEKHTTSATLFRTRGISKTVPSDDYPLPTSVLREEVSEDNSTAWIGASSNSDGTETDDITSETKTDEMFPPEKHPTTEDESRTRRGIVLVDDDFNVSPEPGVNQGWSDGEQPVKSTKTSSTIDEGSGQEEEPPSSPTPSPDLEGSGDDDEPTEPWMNFCLNSTCDSRYMSVFPGHDEIVPVGTNLSLSCVQSNESVVELRWYKYDADGNPVLQADADSESELTFAIPKSRTEDSGRYVCLRGSTAGSCCHRTLHVKVYQVPNYRYHLIVVGVVAAVSLFACLLIGVFRNYKTKKYEVEMELQNMESDCVYKM